MPRFDNEQELLENLRQYAKDGLLSAGYTNDGLEKIRLEIIDGTITIMPRPHVKSALLSSRLVLFFNGIENKEHLDFLLNFDLKIDDHNIYTPKAMIFDNTNLTNDDTFVRDAIVVFEILTNQNKHLLNAKFEHYQTIPTLQEYVLVDGHEPQVWIYRKQNHWQAEHYAHHQSFILQSIDFMVNVVDIYRDVNFDQKQPNQET